MGLFDDLIPGGAQQPQRIEPRARELAVRTMLGEAGQEPDEGLAGVASVILNRVKAGRFGKDIPNVVLAPNQFEPWMSENGRRRMYSFAPDSPQFQRAATIFDRVASGQMPDPTQGATHFFSPTAQAQLGREPPAWAQGDPLVIGRHNFYAPEGRVQTAAQSTPQPQPARSGLFDDLIPQAGEQPQGDPGRFGEAPTGQNFRMMREPESATLKPVPPKPASEASPTQQMLVDFLNQGPAAAQGTTPIVSHQTPNYLGEVIEADSGLLYYADPEFKSWVQVDPSKHVVLTDPADNKRRVYGRTEETDEGRLSAAGRVLMTGMAAGAPTARPAIPVANALKPGQEVVEAATRLGQVGETGAVQVPRVVATDSMTTQRLGTALQNVPGAGNPLVKAAGRTVEQLGTKADEIAETLGVPARAPSSAKEGIVNWITKASAEEVGPAYRAVDELVNPTVTAPLNSTRAAANIIEGRRTLSAQYPSAAVSLLQRALDRPEGLTYQGLKDLRSSFGPQVRGQLITQGLPEAEIKQIYSALTTDLRNVIKEAGGPKALGLWEKANAEYRLASQQREQLAKIVGAKGEVAPEQVLERLISMAGTAGKADAGKLALARNVIGKEGWGDISSAVVARLGRDAEGNFRPESFLKAWGKISDEGKGVLFHGENAQLKGFIDDIAKVSSRFKELNKFSTPSAQNLTSILGGAGLVLDPITTVTSVVGGNVVSRILASPAPAASLARWSRTYEALASNPTTPRLAAFNLASRNLVNTAGLSVSPAEFLKAIQGPMRVPAEEEKQK